jgi:hypothetical protein
MGWISLHALALQTGVGMVLVAAGGFPGGGRGLVLVGRVERVVGDVVGSVDGVWVGSRQGSAGIE